MGWFKKIKKSFGIDGGSAFDKTGIYTAGATTLTRTMWGSRNPLNPWDVWDQDKPDKPKAAAATDEEVLAAAKAEAERLRRRKGRGSTILTSPTGITTEATTHKTTLG